MENLQVVQGRQGGPPWRRSEPVHEMGLFLTFRHRPVAESNRNRPGRRSVARQGGASRLARENQPPCGGRAASRPVNLSSMILASSAYRDPAARRPLGRISGYNGQSPGPLPPRTQSGGFSSLAPGPWPLAPFLSVAKFGSGRETAAARPASAGEGGRSGSAAAISVTDRGERRDKRSTRRGRPPDREA